MKHIYNLLACLLVVLFADSLCAQNTPQGLYYQAVARGLEGEQLSGEELAIRLNILENNTTVYTELHSPTTDTFGLFELVIGNGEVELGQFSEINWGADIHFLNIEIDFGSGFEDVSTTQFLSVPYSLYAAQAETVVNDNVDDADNNPQNEIIESFFIENDSLQLLEAGNTFSIPLAELTDDGDWTIDDESNTLSSQDYNVGVNTTNPNSTLSVNGSISMNITTVTSILDGPLETAVGVNNNVILCDVASGDIIINLPSAESCIGRIYTFKRFDSTNSGGTDANNTLSIIPQTSETIDLQNSLTLESNDYEQVQIVSGEDNKWFIISYSRNP